MNQCDGRYPVPHRREEPFPVTYRCALPMGHSGPHGAEAEESKPPASAPLAELTKLLDEFDIISQQLGKEWPPSSRTIADRNAARSRVEQYCASFLTERDKANAGSP